MVITTSCVQNPEIFLIFFLSFCQSSFLQSKGSQAVLKAPPPCMWALLPKYPHQPVQWVLTKVGLRAELMGHLGGRDHIQETTGSEKAVPGTDQHRLHGLPKIILCLQKKFSYKAATSGLSGREETDRWTGVRIKFRD